MVSTYFGPIVDTARADFERARRRTFYTSLRAALTRKCKHLQSFEQAQPMNVDQRYAGLQQVPIERIVGSVGRYRDFDRNFNPVSMYTRARWESLDRAFLTGTAVPPVELYKIGEAYYVRDGNHRVSVARFHRMDYIDAEVIECASEEHCSVALAQEPQKGGFAPTASLRAGSLRNKLAQLLPHHESQPAVRYNTAQ